MFYYTKHAYRTTREFIAKHLVGILVIGLVTEALAVFFTLPQEQRNLDSLMQSFTFGTVVAVGALCGIALVGYLFNLLMAPGREVVRLVRENDRLVRDTQTAEQPFRIGLQSADGFPLKNEPESYAHLTIASNAGLALEDCSVRLIKVEQIRNGSLDTVAKLNERRYLAWSSFEHAAHGKHNQWINIPPERTLDLAVISNDPDHFKFVCADGNDRPTLPLGWYKVTLSVSSESSTSPQSQTVCLLVNREGPREPPAPLKVSYWEPHGPNLLKRQQLVTFIDEGNELFERARHKGPTSEAPEPIWDAAKEWLARIEVYVQDNFDGPTYYTPLHAVVLRSFPPDRAKATREDLSNFVNRLTDTLQGYINSSA